MKDPNRLHWNQQFKILQDTWPKPDDFETRIKLCLDLHAMVHCEEMSGSGLWSFEDEIWNILTEETFRKYHQGDQSIAWKLWHTGRIEDITMNILIAGDEQVLNTGGWFEKLKAEECDTGNAMGEEEITALSWKIDMQALKEYRIAVGRKTRQIISALKPEELKQKIHPSRLQRLSDEGAVLKEASGIIEYWGGKTYAGLLLMPATRHIFVHLNESLKLIK